MRQQPSRSLPVAFHSPSFRAGALTLTLGDFSHLSFNSRSLSLSFRHASWSPHHLHPSSAASAHLTTLFALSRSRHVSRQETPDAGSGPYGICRVIDASRSPSPDPNRSAIIDSRMKYALGIILSILGWLGIVASPFVIMIGLMSGFASSREQPRIIFTAVGVPVGAVLLLIAGRSVLRGARSTIESGKAND